MEAEDFSEAEGSDEWGRLVEGDYTDDSVSYVSGNGTMRTLDSAATSMMMSVYCSCGRIVVLDRSDMKLKLSLGKQLECMSCRNARISEEIDSINNHFDGVQDDDMMSCEYTVL